MSPAAIAGDFEYAHRSIRAGALLVRLVAESMESGKGAPRADLPQLLAFLADGLLERVEILQLATEQLEANAVLAQAGEGRP